MNMTPQQTAAAIAQLLAECDVLRTGLIAISSTLTPEQQQAARRRLTSVHVAQETRDEQEATPGVIELRRRVTESLYQGLQRAQQKWPNAAPEHD